MYKSAVGGICAILLGVGLLTSCGGGGGVTPPAVPIAPAMVAYEFQSTVSHVYNHGGGLPSGVAEDDTVVFALSLPVDSPVSAAPVGNGGLCGQDPDYSECYLAAWTFEAVPYTLTFSSGNVETGTIDRVELENGGLFEFDPMFPPDPENDSLHFYSGTTHVFEVINHSGAWLPTSTPPGDLNTALTGVDQPQLFNRTMNWATWGNWGTYHYDYIKPQTHTLVTRTP